MARPRTPTSDDLSADDLDGPSPAEVARWRAQHERIQAQIKGLSAKADHLQVLIDAAAPLLKSEEKAPVKALPKPRIINTRVAKKRPVKVKRVPRRRAITLRGRPEGATWTSTIHSILKGMGRGLTHDDLRVELAKGPFAERLEENDKSFYGAIGKLVDRNDVVRHNGWLFDAGTHAKFMADVAAGRVLDLPPAKNAGQRSPVGEAIKSFMAKQNAGATSSEIIEMLKRIDDPEIGPAVEKNKTFAYNVMSRLVERGVLTKGGGRYFIAPNQKEN
jgi:hypothetical protein